MDDSEPMKPMSASPERTAVMDFVGSKAGNQLEVDALFSEVAVFDGHVLRCIENGMATSFNVTFVRSSVAAPARIAAACGCQAADQKYACEGCS